MSIKKVIFLKTNLLNIDPRLTKEIDVLKHAGYSVTLLCWDRWCNDNDNEKSYNVDEIKFRFKSPSGIKILFFFPFGGHSCFLNYS